MPRRPKRDTTNLTDLRAGLYCRVSLDQDGTEKSVNDQEADGRAWAASVGVRLTEEHIYRDADRSASRFATKQRENFDRLVADIKAGELDVIWFWEQSRSTRRVGVFAELRDLCRDMGVLWVIRDRVYDPSDYKDMIAPSMLSVIGEMESEQTSERVQRGKRMSAQAGRPAGKVPYGYRRVFDPNTGKSVKDVPDTWDGDGRPIEDSPAYIVREIYERLAAGDSITAIRKDLDARGIRTQQGFPWENSKIRYVATSPTYLGKRLYQVERFDMNRHSVHRIKAALDGVASFGPPLVDEATFWAVQRILSDPSRTTTRTGPRTGKYLLTALARCAECGGKLSWKKAPADHRRKRFKDMYWCKDRTCVGIYAAALDEYVEAVIVRWLSHPAVVADLTAGNDSAVAQQALVDADRARVELEEWRQHAERGEVSVSSFARAEKGILARISEAERLAQAAALPPVLVGNIGPQAKAGWDALDLSAKRLILRTVADIRVKRVGRGARLPASERVEWRWLLGPDGEDELNED